MSDDTRSRMLETIKAFLGDDQDPAQVERTYAKVSEILTPGEVIEYIAVQKPLMSLTPDSVVLTDKRFIVYRPRVFGRVNFSDYVWRDLADAKLKHGMITSTISCEPCKVLC
jgi:Bacterial PH domain